MSTTVVDPVVRFALSWALAVLFAAAAWHKARDLHVFAAVLWNYELLPAAAVRPVAILLVAMEAALAAGFVVAPFSIPAGCAAAGLMVVYAFAIGVNLARGRYDMSCGCEGGGREQPLHGGLLLRNATIAAAALLVAAAAARTAAARQMIWLDWFTAAVAATTLVALWSAAGRLVSLAAPRWRAR